MRYPRYDPRFAKAHSVNRCGYNVGQAARKVPLPAVMIDVGANVGQTCWASDVAATLDSWQHEFDPP